MDCIQLFKDTKFLCYLQSIMWETVRAIVLLVSFWKKKMDMQLLTQGVRVICLEVPSLSIYFIDSLIFLPMKLSSLLQA